MPEITHPPILPTVRLSLLVVPKEDAARDDATIGERLQRLRVVQEEIADLASFWPMERSDHELFVDFEARMRELLDEEGRAASELMLAIAESHDRENRPAKFEIGEVSYRLCRPEPRSFTTWFGTIRYQRSYARVVDGGVGHFPLDFDLGLLGDRISPSLLATGARLATRMSYAEAREVLGWFVPQPPSTEVLEQTILGLGHHTAAWFEQVPIPEGDGDVFVTLIDGKCVPTVRESELEKRRGPRSEREPAPSPRHRGRANRKERGRPPRRKKGDKAKNGKQVMMVVTYTLRRDGDLLLGPLNRRVYASVGTKRHAFEYARREAERRGFGPRTGRTIQILTDGDPDLHRLTDEYFRPKDFPNRVVTVDIVHVLEKLWEAGRARHKEASDALAAWVHTQEDRLYNDDATAIVGELKRWLVETPKTGPGNKGKRERLTAAIRYLENRLDKLAYGTYRRRDLEVGTGQVEGAIKYVIAKRCDHGGMRWIRERAQAVIQLRCIEVNGNWKPFIRWAMNRLRTRALASGCRARLQTNTPANLPNVNYAA